MNSTSPRAITFQTPARPPADRPWRIKAGFDPTAPDLHLGHAVLFTALRHWQNQGHTVVLLVGDFTATIGDPSGRNQTRPPLTPAQVEENAAAYAAQAFLFLNPARTEVVHNSDWFGAMPAAALVGLAQGVTVAQLLTRQDFRQRLAQEAPLGLHELLYPVLQGYDSVQVRADLEVGGEDQLFNLHMGRTLQAQHGQVPQAIATVPLLLGTDGVRKMSKSYGNHIALRDAPTEVYGKTMRLEDAQVAPWAALLDVPAAVAAGLDAYAAKRALAQGLVEKLHGPEAAAAAHADWDARFVRREVPDAPPRPAPAGARLDKLLVAWGFADSTGQARRKIHEGAVRIDGHKCLDPAHVPTAGVIQVGRRQAARLMAG